MKYFFTILFLTNLNFLYAQESDTTKVAFPKIQNKKTEKLQHDRSYNDSKLINGKVVKIDSIDNYYLTYVENRNISYKIISEKSSNRIHCNKIILDSIYDFRITQLTFDTKPQENSSNIPTPINYLDIGKCLRFKNSEICTEPGFDNLFKSEYLNGLCNKL